MSNQASNRASSQASTMRKWAMWIPVLMVASLVYWAVALGLGGLSLAMVGSLDDHIDFGDAGEGQEPHGDELKDSYEPITVNLVESSDTRDVAEAAADSSVASPAAQERGDQGPGQTAF